MHLRVFQPVHVIDYGREKFVRIALSRYGGNESIDHHAAELAHKPDGPILAKTLG